MLVILASSLFLGQHKRALAVHSAQIALFQTSIWPTPSPQTILFNSYFLWHLLNQFIQNIS